MKEIDGCDFCNLTEAEKHWLLFEMNVGARISRICRITPEDVLWCSGNIRRASQSEPQGMDLFWRSGEDFGGPCERGIRSDSL